VVQHDDTNEDLHLTGSLGVVALHGGRIEPGTEEIARFVARQSGASLYVYSGRRPVGNLALHQPSHGSDFKARPLVLRFLNHVQTIISIHGHGRRKRCVYVGGLNQPMAEGFVELAEAVLPQYEWVSDPDGIPEGIRGRNPNNIVNLVPKKGMQLELPRALRQTKPALGGDHFEPVGDALALSRLLVQFAGKTMASDSQHC